MERTGQRIRNLTHGATDVGKQIHLSRDKASGGKELLGKRGQGIGCVVSDVLYRLDTFAGSFDGSKGVRNGGVNKMGQSGHA